jgi:hypothetical protein
MCLVLTVETLLWTMSWIGVVTGAVWRHDYRHRLKSDHDRWAKERRRAEGCGAAEPCRGTAGPRGMGERSGRRHRPRATPMTAGAEHNDPTYIVDLIKKVTTVSVENMKLVSSFSGGS